MQQENRDPATNKEDGDERHMRSSCDLHMYTDTSISMFTRVNGHMCTHVHMRVHAHTALIKTMERFVFLHGVMCAIHFYKT